MARWRIIGLPVFRVGLSDLMERKMTADLPYWPRLVLRLALAAVACTPAAWAQDTAPTPMLKSNQVTEDVLVDALAIDQPGVADGANGATRGFRPATRPGGSTFQPGKTSGPPKPAAPGKANLLITFATGSAELSPETIKVLETVAKALQSDRLAGFAFRIEGHADPRGGMEYNLKLSEERAQSVASYLTSKLGVLPDRIQPVGKGSAELLNPEQPDAQENRRVTIVTTP
jgi:OmpA-OmpF porin, OOP family